MKRRWTILLTAIILVLQFIFGSFCWAADFSNLIILHTNDTHGYDIYDQSKGNNGMAVIAGVKKDLEKQGYDVVLLDAGDMIQGKNLANMTQGERVIATMNQVGYDAAALGNHEFDYGQDVLFARVKQAKFPFICANVIVEATKKTLVQPNYIIKKGKNKIGVFGLSTPSTKVSTNPKNVVGLDFLIGDELFQCAQKQVDQLKAEGCDLIIAVGHMGSEEACRGYRSDDILENVQGIDILIDGHDHAVKNAVINGSLLVETGSYTKNIGRIVYKDGKWQENLIKFGEYTQEEKKTKKVLDKAEKEINIRLGEIVGESKVDLNGNFTPGVRTMETNAGDFVADSILWQATQAQALEGKVDCAFINGGAIRDSLKSGKIILSDLVSINPFNSEIYVFQTKGSVLLEMFEAATCTTPNELGSFPQVAGIEYVINTKVPYAKGKQYENSTYYAPEKPGSRVTIKTVGGQKFDLNTVYTCATNNFVTSGGDSYGAMLVPGNIKNMKSTGYNDVQTLVNYIKTGLGGVIDERYAEPQNRITILK